MWSLRHGAHLWSVLLSGKPGEVQSGAHRPAGEHLIELMRHSNEVTETILALCGRSEVCVSLELACLRTTLVRMLTTADEIIGKED